MLYPMSRAALFRLEPERAHGLALGLIASAGVFPGMRELLRLLYAPSSTETVEVFGLSFGNRVGLAAGYDKDATGYRGLACLGFGHIEVGTVTPQAQPGNPRPRVFRLVAERCLINRMGFPSRGAAFVADQLARGKPDGLVVGVNLGKQKSTELEQAAEDYEQLVERFAPLADYLAINISSPNTPGLRRLQEREFLEQLLCRVMTARNRCAGKLGRGVPLLVKLAPDLEESQLATALEALDVAGVDGVIATNTTLSREGVTSVLQDQDGGLSGAALTQRSTQVIRRIAQLTGGKLPIVGVGGIMGPDDARAKLDAGAVLIQVYTGLIYEGPGLVRRIVEATSPGLQQNTHE